ncbi:MAG: hypothetical protein ACXW6K_18135 [Candidatus Binatia bacterium]
MSGEVILARLVLINDHLIELLKWAVENDKPDFAVKLASIPKVLCFYPQGNGANQLEVLKHPGRRQSSRKVAFE